MQSMLAARSSSSFLVRSPMVAQPARMPVAPVKLTTVDVAAGQGGKMKTRKAAAKRFKVTGSGKVMARHSCKQHLNEKMTRKHIRENSKMYTVSKADIANVSSCLPYSGVNSK